jgi:hypothetical protein
MVSSHLLKSTDSRAITTRHSRFSNKASRRAKYIYGLGIFSEMRIKLTTSFLMHVGAIR